MYYIEDSNIRTLIAAFFQGYAPKLLEMSDEQYSFHHAMFSGMVWTLCGLGLMTKSEEKMTFDHKKAMDDEALAKIHKIQLMERGEKIITSTQGERPRL